MTSLLEKWQYYLKDFCSPQSFVDWGFYSMVSATLQRRVWLGSNQKKLYGNMFTILTGPPGVGKGMVLGEVSSVFRHPKMQVGGANGVIAQEVLAGDGHEEYLKADNSAMKRMLIPIAPNATTYEALCRTMSQASRHFYVPTGELLPNGSEKTRIEQQSSILFLLEEFGSLFRKHTEDIHTFCNETYDAKDPYEYRTKNQGTDYIRKPCVNILAGTTPDFLKRVFASAILTEGFASRSVFVVAMKNRFRMYETPVFAEDQLKAYEDIVDHVVKLSKIKGLVKFTPDALEFNKQWFEKDYATRLPNANPKLIPYYARINITHAKLCMAMHFGRTTDINEPITLTTAQEALSFLQATEANMHLALAGESKNPLSEATDAVYKFMLANGTASRKQLLVEFYDIMPKPIDDLETILTYLKSTGKIKESDKPNTFEII